MSVITLAFSAFIAGILGSIHCIGMCGGIACSAGYLSKQSQPSEVPVTFHPPSASKPSNSHFLFYSTLTFNLGRICTYTLLGVLVAFLGHHIIHLSDTRSILRVFRYASAVLIALIGFKYLFGLRLIDRLEKAGQGIWHTLSARFKFADSSVLSLGMVWGLLPCGLIYTMLLTASAAGSVLGGALIMFAFGLGTLPALLSVSALSHNFRELAKSRWMKTVFGLALILLAALLIGLELNTPSTMCHKDFY